MTAGQPPPPALIPGTDIPAIADNALGWLCARFEGNAASRPRLGEHTTTAHLLHGAVVVRLKSEVTKTQAKGRQPQGDLALSAQDAVTKANAAAQSFLHAKDILEGLRVTLDHDPGHGWGMEDTKIRPGQAKKTFSYVETCLKCHGQGYTACIDCKATGHVTCTLCHGTGLDNDPRHPLCDRCMGAKQLLCTRCNGQRRNACLACDRAGVWTDIWHAACVAELSFVADPQGADPAALEAAVLLDPRAIATEGHAEILREAPVVEKDSIVFPMAARLAVARVEFLIDGKPHKALAAGLHGRVLRIDPVLDPAVKPGINALLRLSKGPMAAQALMETACKYRLVRDAVTASARHSKKAVYAGIVKEYPLVVSDKYARAAAHHAGNALASLSARPRHLGLALGGAVAGALAAGWWLGLRPALPEGLIPARVLPAVDLLVWGAGWGLSVLVIRDLVARTLKRILPREAIAEGGTPVSAGSHVFYALLLTLCVWLAAAVAAKPDWLSPLLKKAGLQ